MKAIFIVSMIALSALTHGWATSTIWGWVLVPLGVPSLSIGRAYALCVLVGLWTHQHRQDDKAPTLDLAFILGRAVILPAGAVLMAWLGLRLLP
jgi:hypothetical protein